MSSKSKFVDGRAVKLPSLTPDEHVVWERSFRREVNDDYGDATDIAWGGEVPLYYTSTYEVEYHSAILTVDAMPKGIAKKIQTRAHEDAAARWSKLQHKLDSDWSALYGRMVQHMSHESELVCKRDLSTYEVCERERDPQKLLKLIRDTHGHRTQAPTAMEKQQALDDLRNAKQFPTEDAPVWSTLESHNATFSELYKKCITLECDFATKTQHIRYYLESVDHTFCESELRECLKLTPPHTNYPTDLPAAFKLVDSWNVYGEQFILQSNGGKAKVEEMKSQRSGTGGKANAANDKKRKLELQASKEDKPKCQFCKLRHGGSECWAMKKYIEVNASSVNEFLTSYKKKGDSKAHNASAPPTRSKAEKNKARKARKAEKRAALKGNVARIESGTSEAFMETVKSAWLAYNEECGEDQQWGESEDQGESAVQCLVNLMAKDEDLRGVEVSRQVIEALQDPSVWMTIEKLIGIYDPGANCNLVKDESLCWDVKSIVKRKVVGVGEMVVTKKGMTIFGPAYICPGLAINIFSHSQIRQQGIHTYHNSKESEDFVLNEVCRCKPQRDDLFWIDEQNYNRLIKSLTSNAIDELVANTAIVCKLQTEMSIANMIIKGVDGNEYVVSAEEKRRAKAVAKLHDILNHPGDEYFAVLLDSNEFINCPYTSRDLRTARKVLGPCDACLKAKHTKPTPSKMTLHRAIAREPGYRLCADIYFVSYVGRSGKMKKHPYFFCVDDFSNYMHIIKLKSKTTRDVWQTAQDVMSWYASYNWPVLFFATDHETVFGSLRGLLAANEPRVELEFNPTETHAEKAERMTRVVRERSRVITINLWYEFLTFLTAYLLEDIAMCHNAVPSKRLGHSAMYAVESKKLNYLSHLQYEIMSVGEFRVPNLPDQARALEERTATGIIVGRNLDEYGSFEVYLIDSNRVVNRAKLVRLCNHTAELRSTLASLQTKEGSAQDELIIEPVTDLASKRLREERDNETVELRELFPKRAVPETFHRPMEKPIPVVVTEEEEKGVVEDESIDVTEETVIANDEGDTQCSGTPTLPRRASKKADRRSRKLREKVLKSQPPQKPKKKLRREEIKRPSRERRMPTRYANNLFANILKLQEATLKYPHDVVKGAIEKEVRNIFDRECGTPIKKPQKDLLHKEILPVGSHFEEKFSPINNEFIKLKFRVTPGGNRVNDDLYSPGDKSSPTVGLDSLLACLNIATLENMHAFTADITAAYLNSVLANPHMLRFSKVVAAVIVELYPEYADYLQPDGSMLFLCKKAVYGLPESGKAWWVTFKATLEKLGYKNNPVEPCVFVKEDNNGKSILCIWVDDILGFSNSEVHTKYLDDELTKIFGSIGLCRDEELPYLGMAISQPRNGESSMRMTEYIKKICKARGIHKGAKDPNHPDLLCKDDNKKDKTPVDTTDYLSMLMSAMFVAKRAKPQCLAALSILASRVQSPNNTDMKCLVQVYQYMYATQSTGVRFTPTSTLLEYWVDASYNLHDDSSGHGGIVVMMGKDNGPILAISKKQKLPTRSSCESELVTLDLALNHLLWFSMLMEFLGYPQRPIPMYQDNKSTIHMCEAGDLPPNRLKHMACRTAHIKSKIQDGRIVLVYCPTAEMLADVLTKPLKGAQFKQMTKLLVNAPDYIE